MFNPIQFYEAGKQRIFPINTIIGGVAASISTKALLASKLGIAESEIRRFDIVGSDINANIRSDYSLANDSFYNNSNLTKYKDLDAHVISVGINSLRNTGLNELLLPKDGIIANTSSITENNNLLELDLKVVSAAGSICGLSSTIKKIYFSKLESITTKAGFFSGLTSLELLDIKKLKVYGSPSTGGSPTNSGFANLKLNCEIQANIFLKTANSGSPDAALTWVKANRSALVKFYNDDGTYNSTL